MQAPQTDKPAAPEQGDFAAIAFAGGGNRCYWQGGFWDALTALRPQRPRFVVGVSAGASRPAFRSSAPATASASAFFALVQRRSAGSTGLCWRAAAPPFSSAGCTAR